MVNFVQILKFFSSNIAIELDKFLKNTDVNISNTIEEIRLRSNRQLILKFNAKEIVLNYIVTNQDLIETLQRICDNSIYTYQGQICNGYITVKGGHRVGITGNVVMQEDKVININYIFSLNFRIAKQIIGCSNKLLKYVLDTENNSVYNTLIISPPGVRKNYNVKRFIKKN